MKTADAKSERTEPRQKTSIQDGKIPEGWGVKKLSDFCDILMGQSPPSSVYNTRGEGLPFFQGRKDFVEKYPSKAMWCSKPTRIASSGDVLLSVRAPVGDVNVATEKCCIGRGLSALSIKNDNKEFLYYLLLHNQDRLKQIFESEGTVFGCVTKEGLRDFEVMLPIDDRKQRAIAKILSDLDDKIELNNQINKTLESIAQAIFKRWFVENDNAGGRIPITDILEFDPKMVADKEDILPYMDMKELSTESMTVGNVILKPFSGGSKFQNNDTLLARITPCLENGKTAFVGFLTDEHPIGFGSTEFIVMRAKEGISPQFVYCLARDPEFRSFAIKSMIGSSGRQRVQRNMLETYEISKPDQESMDKFHKVTLPLFSKVIENRKETNALIRLRNSLLPRLMTGKIRVN
jgi:type I restriction enzyme S subunit